MNDACVGAGLQRWRPTGSAHPPAHPPARSSTRPSTTHLLEPLLLPPRALRRHLAPPLLLVVKRGALGAGLRVVRSQQAGEREGHGAETLHSAAPCGLAALSAAARQAGSSSGQARGSSGGGGGGRRRRAHTSAPLRRRGPCAPPWRPAASPTAPGRSTSCWVGVRWGELEARRDAVEEHREQVLLAGGSRRAAPVPSSSMHQAPGPSACPRTPGLNTNAAR